MGLPVLGPLCLLHYMSLKGLMILKVFFSQAMILQMCVKRKIRGIYHVSERKY
jgi:hypothetical protein